jgi:hypothetical protein
MRLRRAWIAAAMVTLAASAPATGAPAPVSATLIWTAPGDDGMIGAAARYDIRYSTTAITLSSFNSCPRVTNPPLPFPAGRLQTVRVDGLEVGRVYYFALRTADERGNLSPLSNLAVLATSVDNRPELPTEFGFAAPRPNPAKSPIMLPFTLPQEAQARIEAYDIGGRRVRTVVDLALPAGSHEVRWDLEDGEGQRLAPGLYFLRATLGPNTFTRRVTITR